MPGKSRLTVHRVREVGAAGFWGAAASQGSSAIGTSRALGKWIARMGHLQEGLRVSYAGLQAKRIRDGPDMQVPERTCKST